MRSFLTLLHQRELLPVVAENRGGEKTARARARLHQRRLLAVVAEYVAGRGLELARIVVIRFQLRFDTVAFHRMIQQISRGPAALTGFACGYV